jgi:L-galactono-1,4-lactone dehydrogenase
MWIPHTDTVVVVKCNETKLKEASQPGFLSFQKQYSNDEKLEPMRELLTSRLGEVKDMESMSATQLRDALLAVDPVNQQWVIKVNKAEAEFWKRNSGHRVGWSDEILGFDCGGQQWVLEVAFPTKDTEPAPKEPKVRI